jgi:hypothetical protein
MGVFVPPWVTSSATSRVVRAVVVVVAAAVIVVLVRLRRIRPVAPVQAGVDPLVVWSKPSAAKMSSMARPLALWLRSSDLP